MIFKWVSIFLSKLIKHVFKVFTRITTFYYNVNLKIGEGNCKKYWHIIVFIVTFAY